MCGMPKIALQRKNNDESIYGTIKNNFLYICTTINIYTNIYIMNSLHTNFFQINKMVAEHNLFARNKNIEAKNGKTKTAICHFTSSEKQNDNGYAFITEYQDKTIVRLDLYNLPPGLHGFHIHEFADMRKGCNSLGSHYNPFKHPHSGPNQKINHIGDLGNIMVNDSGRCDTEIIVDYLQLNGPYGVIGRSMVIHEKADDLGKGSDEESKKTGNSGTRISCGIIGYM